MLVGTYKHFCNRCGRILTKPKDIAKGYGPACWRIVRPKEVRPYIQEVPFVDTGTTDYLERSYPALTDWRDSF